ncbi:MAG: magnesium protoporphyrin IX methyltransferase [Acidiphilium sp.]
MSTSTYERRRSEIETYFDRTALAAWARMTSDAPLGRIRATVRAGRDAMRASLLAMLPTDLTGARLLDAGCGTGALALEAARRGAHVVGIDISPQLIGIARDRAANDAAMAQIEFSAGDMLDPSHGRFDYVIAMDSLIHYAQPMVVAALASLAPRVDQSILFTFAPRTPVLATMHLVGRQFPRSDRAPMIEPLGERALHQAIRSTPSLSAFSIGRSEKITSGFYVSKALELRR